jgi:hypothetical protein
MWQLELPHNIQEEVCSAQNPSGHITINDPELTDAVLNCLALEAQNLDIRHKHITMFCDNMPTVSWATAFRHLLQVLGMMCIHASSASSLTTMYIKGQENVMVDTVSHAFKSGNFFQHNKILHNISILNFNYHREDPGPSTSFPLCGCRK